MSDDVKKIDPELYAKLVKAEADFEAGRLSRRSFNKILGLAAAAAGLTVAETQPAYAWVSTRMRKRRSGVSSFTPAASLRLSAASSTNFTRTPSGAATATERKKIGLSMWVKKTQIAAAGYQALFTTYFNGSSGATYQIAFQSDDTIRILEFSSYPTIGFQLVTTQVFRDPSAWMHIFFLHDSDQAVPSARCQLWVNGQRMISFTTETYPSLAYSSVVGTTNAMAIGSFLYPGASNFMDGCVSEVYLTVGQDVSASSFGKIDATTGQWVPKQYTGSFGTNGFYLPFKSAAAANGSGTASGSYPNVTGVAGLGADYSGNNNHWTASGLTTNDQILDLPTNNYCTLNAALYQGGVLVNGALGFRAPINNYCTGGTYTVTTGKWYFEATGTASSSCMIGIAAGSAASFIYYNQYNTQGTGYTYSSSGSLYVVPSTTEGSLPTYTAGDVIGIAFDVDAGTVQYYKNGTLVYTKSSIPAGLHWTPVVGESVSTNTVINCNFGQGGQSGLTYNSASGGSFKYAPPSGYKALCTANLPVPAIVKPSQYFSALTYTGNGGIQRIGSVIPSASGYQVAKSLRFKQSSSAYLSRTPSSSSGQDQWTYSVWAKRASLSYGVLVGAGYVSGNYYTQAFCLNGTGQFEAWAFTNASGYAWRRISNEQFQDASSWMHFVIQYDPNNATSAGKLRVWVNGSELTWGTQQDSGVGGDWSSYRFVNSTYENWIGCSKDGFGPGNLWDGSFTEANMISGSLVPYTSFGQTDATSGEWVPKAYAGAFGTNGFHLDFSDSSNTTSATLGKDSSGNGNNWTPNGFSVTDSLADSPTANFCTLDPNVKGAGVTLTTGNLTWTSTTATGYAYTGGAAGTLPMSSGKWYFEYKHNGPTYSAEVGVIAKDYPANYYLNNSAVGAYMYYGYSAGTFYSDGTGVSYGATFTDNDVIGIAFDADNGVLTFYKNGVSQGIATSALPKRTYYPWITAGSSNVTMSGIFNFGQGGQSGLTYDSASGGSFKYTPPTGYKALCTANLAAPSTDVFQSTPDLVWVKGRSGATDHAFYDTSRGPARDWMSNSDAAETTQPNGVTSFTKTGFTTGSLAKLNTANATYAAWMWKKGATPGFDVVTYTGTGAARTIAHSLGAAPSMMMIKNRDQGAGYHGIIYHKYLSASPQTSYIHMSQNNAVMSDGGVLWNSTAPTASAFSLNTNGAVNANGNRHVAYLWTDVPGFSRFASFIGNGTANGPFVWCGFRPRWIMLRNVSTASSMGIYDTARNTFNVVNADLYAELASAESTAALRMDILSNGFKIRDSGTYMNGSGHTFIFAAFAEAPFKYANGR